MNLLLCNLTHPVENLNTRRKLATFGRAMTDFFRIKVFKSRRIAPTISLKAAGAKLAPFNWGGGGVSARIALRNSMMPCRENFFVDLPPRRQKNFGQCTI
jgi:hypothetical protein